MEIMNIIIITGDDAIQVDYFVHAGWLNEEAIFAKNNGKRLDEYCDVE